MGEHRVDQLATRNRPVPGPLPVVPIDLPEAGAARPRPPRGRHPRWWRSASRMLRSRRGRWVLISLACVAVLLVGLLVEGFLSSAAPPVSAPNDALRTYAPAPLSASPSKAKKSSSAPSGSGLVSDPVGALRSSFPYNPLNNLHGPGIHQVVISAWSSGHIAVLGYLVPTGLGQTYGVVKGHPRSWSVSERALGKGYLAAIFIQSDKAGAPITCTVSVDGRVTDRETASGSYGRSICLG